jgi:hypothetical protein
MGVRCLDGRTLQPGRGSPRPRGFVTGSPIPDGSYGGASRSVPMVALLHTYGATVSLARLVRHGTRAAKRCGASRRAALLEAIESHGAGAFRTTDVRRGLLNAAGPAAGGLLTDEDLDGALPEDLPGTAVPLGPGFNMAVAPWSIAATEAPLDSPSANGMGRVIVAADGRGLVAAIAFAPVPGGLTVPHPELVWPRAAAPVLRGVSRMTPGTARPAPAPIGVLERKDQGWFAAAGWLGVSSWRTEPGAGSIDTLQQWLEYAVANAPSGVGLAVSSQRGRTAVTRITADPTRA